MTLNKLLTIMIVSVALATGGYAGDLFIDAGGPYVNVNDNSIRVEHMINDGTLHGGSGTINVSGNWINNGTFNYGTSQVSLEGSFQKYTGSTTFYNFSKVSTGPDTFEVAAGHAINIVSGGKLHVEGFPGSKLNWVSDASNGWWYLNSAGTEEVRYVSVASSDASGGHTIYSYNSLPAGGPNNTINWYWSFPKVALKAYMQGFYLGGGLQRRETPVIVHLRQGPDQYNSYAVATKEAILTVAGTTTEVDFMGTTATQGDYFIAVFHNFIGTMEGVNHLAIATANTKYLDSLHTEYIDFTVSSEVYGADATWTEADGSASMRGGDADGSGRVNTSDQTILYNGWGGQSPSYDMKPDFNGDGRVNTVDLTIMQNNWGRLHFIPPR
ncbi:MAG: dockerin type I domain-containing protein [Syntrophales bacterium]